MKKQFQGRIILVIGLIALALIIFVPLISSIYSDDSASDFNSLYKACCSPSYAKVGADGSYLSIDTNPDDLEGYSNDAAVRAIIYVNNALELPDYLLDDMSKTTALMGRQTETFKRITVSWSYHPDRGLEVTYKKTK